MRYKENEFPLHFAAESGNLDMLRKLVDCGQNPDSKDQHLRTPLMIAAWKNKRDIAEFLIKRGADINAKDRRNGAWDGHYTPLHFACEDGLVEMAELLLSNGANPDPISQFWSVPLSGAIMVRNERLAMCLLNFKANPNGPAKCDRLPIVSAASTNNAMMIQELLKRGADPNRFGGDGRLALCETTDLQCAQILIDGGALVNGRDRNGVTVFHSLISVLSDDMVLFLIKCGANVNEVRLENGTAPLHCLTYNPNCSVARILIEAGADVNLISDHGTPLDMCLYLKETSVPNPRLDEFINLLNEHGAKTSQKLSGI